MQLLNAAGETPPGRVVRGRAGDGGPTLGAPVHPVPPRAGASRRRLWALAAPAQGAVIGLCLPIASLRRLAGEAVADDHALHGSVIARCRTRTVLAERVHQALDSRHALAVQRAGRLRTEDALAAWWRTQCAGPELPGAIWAVLTHPSCTPALEHRVLGEVHRLQGPPGMARRADLARQDELADENAVLGRLLAQAQARAAQQAAEHARERDELQRLAMRLRAEILWRTTEAQGLRDELERQRSVAPEPAAVPSRLAAATPSGAS